MAGSRSYLGDVSMKVRPNGGMRGDNLSDAEVPD